MTESSKRQSNVVRADLLKCYGITGVDFTLHLVKPGLKIGKPSMSRIGFKVKNSPFVTLDISQASKLATDLRTKGDDDLAEKIVKQVKKAVRESNE